VMSAVRPRWQSPRNRALIDALYLCLQDSRSLAVSASPAAAACSRAQNCCSSLA
jgi:hypothetical protein